MPGMSACRATGVLGREGVVKRSLEIGDARANGGIDGSGIAVTRSAVCRAALVLRGHCRGRKLA